MSDKAGPMHRRFFWGPWMFSPATVLCIAVFLGCIWIQATGLRLPRLVLIYLYGIEGTSLFAALLCSAISIGRVSFSEPFHIRPETIELSQGLSKNPTAGDAYPMPPPEPMPEDEEAEAQSETVEEPETESRTAKIFDLDHYRRR